MTAWLDNLIPLKAPRLDAHQLAGWQPRSVACEIAIDTGDPEPLTPGEKVPLVFSLTPGPVRLRPGDKLRFDVASRADLLKSGVSHGYVHFDIPAPPYFSRNTLHDGPGSYIKLWQVGP